jgi:hypothetical protein
MNITLSVFRDFSLQVEMGQASPKKLIGCLWAWLNISLV